ncbi:MAG: Ig-like domain-containing protein [Oscillospiraceae bacterium]|nr:Ig-like domain-containing protein [Oscillospiraceae bacterium]
MVKLIEGLKKLAEKLIESVKKKPAIWAISTVTALLVGVFGFITADYFFGDKTLSVINEEPQDIENLDIAAEESVFEPAPTELVLHYGRDEIPLVSSFLTSVIPNKTAGKVVIPDSDFHITTAHDITAEELKSRLVLESPAAYDFSLDFVGTKDGENSFVLSSNDVLPDGSIVRLALLDDNGIVERRWTFQTAPIFNITSTYPGNERDSVPVDTGIEIYFTTDVNPADMKDFFTMSDVDGNDIEGSFRSYRNTVVFVPSSQLKRGEFYIVTIKEGLPSADGLILEEGQTFSFQTTTVSYEPFFYVKGGISETFLPGDPAVLEFICNSALQNLDFEITLYQFDNAAIYRENLQEYASRTSWYREHVFNISEMTGLREVYSSTEKLMSISYSNFLLLPENLEQGYYIAEVKSTPSNTRLYKAQKLIQINPISVYSSRLPNESLFFINDTVTGAAAGNAQVSITTDGNNFTGQTNSRGIVNINVAAEKRDKAILEIDYNGSKYLDLFDCRQYTERTPEENYFMHLYTDRETYKTTDDIYVWGVIIPREKDIPLPTNLHLQAGEDTENFSIPVNLRPDGTFQAHIKVANNIETWNYPIFLMTDDVRMARKNVRIKDYVNPLYVFDTDVPFYTWMPHKNPTKLALTATFFEGTPAKDITFKVAGDELVTDEYGYAETTVLRPDVANDYYSNNTWRPRMYNPQFVLTGIENEYQTKNVSIYELYRDVMLETDYSANNGSGTLNITTSMVEPTNFVPIERNETTSYYSMNYYPYFSHREYFGNYDIYYNYNYYSNYESYDFAEILRGAPVDVEVTGELTRYWWEAIPKGSYYDFIEKVNKTEYNYERREEKVGTYTVNTVNGRGIFNNLPVGIEDSSYEMKLTWKDTQGQNVEQTTWFYQTSDHHYRRDYTIHNYSLRSDSRTFTQNEALTFELVDNGIEVKTIPPNAKIFMAVSGSEFITVETFDVPSFSHIMSDSYIPNVYISGAYFDGRHVFPLHTYQQYTFDSSEREIIVEITADKEKYSPSERAEITVTAKDLKGRSVPGARVHLSVVDEAAFAIRDQKIDTLRMLYAYIGIPTIHFYHSYIQHSLFGPLDGWGGGGGGDGEDTPVRRDFKDNAAFLSGTTDENGVAKFNVSLPDNLTAWRLTAQVIGDDVDGNLCAGNTKEPLIVTIPFFLTVNSLPEYVFGDDVSVSARINGVALINSDVSETPIITGRLTGENVDITVTAYSDESLNFGKLPIGMYTLLVRASEGINSDAIELPIEVVHSLLEIPVTRSFSLNEGMQELIPLRYPVTLRFYDERDCIYTDMGDYLFTTWSQRTDYRVARSFASMQLGFIEKEDYLDSLNDITTSESLIRLFPHGDEDLTLTALLCVSAPEIVNKSRVTRKFYEIITDKDNAKARYVSTEKFTTAYLGLAALGEPVLFEIVELLENHESLKQADILRLTAALALLGDEENALKHYLAATEKDFANVEIIASGEITIKIKDDYHTALAILTAGTLNLPEAEGMAKYLMSRDRKTQKQTFVLEIMNYIKHYNGVIAEPAEFTYTLFDETHTVALNRRWGETIRFGKEQLENVRFEVTSGDVGVRAFYVGTVSEIQEKPTFWLNKTYTLVEGDEWVPGALIRVSVHVIKPRENYNIEDVIPSGARYVDSDTENTTGWLHNRSLQRVSGSLCRCSTCDSKFSYHIRLVNSGEFVAESAVVYDNQGNWGMSERKVVVIK